MAVLRDGRVVFVNGAAEAFLGRKVGEVLSAIGAHDAGPGDVFEVEVAQRTGRRRIVEIRLRDAFWDGAPARLAVLSDVTHQRRRAAGGDVELKSALAHAAAELNGEADPTSILERSCRLASELLACRVARAYLWRADEDAFVPGAGDGDPPFEAAELQTGRLPRWRIAGLLGLLDADDVVAVTSGSAPDPAVERLLASLGCDVADFAVLRDDGRIVGFLVAGGSRGCRPLPARAAGIARGLARIASRALGKALRIAEGEVLHRARGEFVATMSHELRAPLHVICGFQSLLLEGDFGPLTAEQEDALKRIGKSAGQLLELIDNTLNLNRIEAGRLGVELREVSARDVLVELELETRDRRATSTVESVWNVPDDLPVVRTDVQKVKLALRNLIGNALKYTDAGRIAVAARATGDGVEFSVADTGIGIAPAALRTIFEPFRQVRDGSSTDRGGVGLGLHIVQRMVDMIGGRVRVESRFGVGSTFYVWIPIAPPAAA